MHGHMQQQVCKSLISRSMSFLSCRYLALDQGPASRGLPDLEVTGGSIAVNISGARVGSLVIQNTAGVVTLDHARREGFCFCCLNNSCTLVSSSCVCCRLQTNSQVEAIVAVCRAGLTGSLPIALRTMWSLRMTETQSCCTALLGTCFVLQHHWLKPFLMPSWDVSVPTISLMNGKNHVR